VGSWSEKTFGVPLTLKVASGRTFRMSRLDWVVVPPAYAMWKSPASLAEYLLAAVASSSS